MKYLIYINIMTIFCIISSCFSQQNKTSSTIDKEWWDNLDDEWKNILLINQNFSKQHVNIFKIQEEYMNRLKTKGEENYSEMNTSLRRLIQEKEFGLSYYDFYARAIRTKHLTQNDTIIDLVNLKKLDVIYMINGPKDLTPLEKFPNLKVLIMNFFGSFYEPGKEVDIEPLRNLKELKILHCSSNKLKSLEPIKDLIQLEELVCNNNYINTLTPLKKLKKLKKLSFSSKAKKLNIKTISQLDNLEELYLEIEKKVPNLSKLKKLKKLAISESEMAVVDRRYWVKKIDFLENLNNLEFLDLEMTSYRGSLNVLYNLKNIKAITLPTFINSITVKEFINKNKNCVIVNSYEFKPY